MKCVLVSVKNMFLDFFNICKLSALIMAFFFFYKKCFALYKHKHDNIFYDEAVKVSLFHLHWTSNEIRRQVKRTVQDFIYFKLAA